MMASDKARKTIQQILGFIVLALFIVLGVYFFYEGYEAIGSAIITISLAGYSIALAITSEWRMRTISRADIQQSIIGLLEIRRRYFDDVNDLMLNYIKKKKAIPNDVRTKMITSTSWATWLHYENLKKALCFKNYLTPYEKKRFLRLHRTLMDNAMKTSPTGVLTNENVEHLIMACSLLKQEYKGLGDFENKYYDILKKYIGKKNKGEKFASYLKRKSKELKDKGENNIFQPFK